MALQLALAFVAEATPESLPCTEQCPDDDSSGTCPSDCFACACCNHRSVFEAAADPKVLPIEVALVLTDLEAVAPRAPAPAVLLRPPILPLA
jgi:hypothetical protein